MPEKHAIAQNRPNAFDPQLVLSIVARTRADQGLPPTVSDPAVLGRLATLIGCVRERQAG